jgi:hypothetical protein
MHYKRFVICPDNQFTLCLPTQSKIHFFPESRDRPLTPAGTLSVAPWRMEQSGRYSFCLMNTADHPSPNMETALTETAHPEPE